MLNKLSTFRARGSMSQAQLASAVNVSPQTIASIEKGKYDPSLPLANEISRFFRVAIEDVFPVANEETVPTTATFVMTDIVGSTALVHELGESYVEVLRAHRELLVDIFTRCGGRVVDDSGDACFAAFERPGDAITAALAAQRAIAALDFPAGATVRIRIGIHSGEAYAVGNRFVGLAVHEAARVCAQAEGGQILVSEATASSGGVVELADEIMRDLKGVGTRRLYALAG